MCRGRTVAGEDDKWDGISMERRTPIARAGDTGAETDTRFILTPVC